MERNGAPVGGKQCAGWWAMLLLLVAFTGPVLACDNPQAITSVENVKLSAPVQLLKWSFENTKQLHSFRAHIDLEMTMLGQELPISMEMAVAENQRIRMLMTMGTPQGKMDLETIMAEEYVFTRLPGMGWIRMSSGALTGLTGQPLQALNDPMALYKNLFPGEDVPWELYTVEYMDTEDVDGVQTEHLSIRIDVPEIWQRMDKETKDQFGQAFALGGVGTAEALQQIQVNGLEVWIDGEGYNRRTVMEVVLGREMSMNLDMRMFDFNEEIEIDLPETYGGFTVP